MNTKINKVTLFAGIYHVFIGGLFVFISVTRQPSRATFRDENNIPCLRSQSWDIAQYSEITSQSNCAILGGSRVAYTKYKYTPRIYIYIYIHP